MYICTQRSEQLHRKTSKNTRFACRHKRTDPTNQLHRYNTYMYIQYMYVIYNNYIAYYLCELSVQPRVPEVLAFSAPLNGEVLCSISPYFAPSVMERASNFPQGPV